VQEDWIAEKSVVVNSGNDQSLLQTYNELNSAVTLNYKMLAIGNNNTIISGLTYHY
jgi:hypothetical protein